VPQILNEVPPRDPDLPVFRFRHRLERRGFGREMMASYRPGELGHSAALTSPGKAGRQSGVRDRSTYRLYARTSMRVPTSTKIKNANPADAIAIPRPFAL
jgi:hypothetical protein